MSQMTALENPYFDAVAGAVTVGSCRDSYKQAAVDLLTERHNLVEEYAWAIPNVAAIETLCYHEPVLEVGAGTGYWAWCVEQLDGESVATEPEPPTVDPYTDLIAYDALAAIETVREYEPEEYTLYCCWPDHQAEWPADALDEYEGATFIYVGEGRGGCTGDERFHRKLHDEWTLDETVAIPTYLGIHDRLEVWHR